MQTNSGSDGFDEIENSLDEILIEDENEIEDEDDAIVSQKKSKERNVDYGKVATAIGNFKTRGIKVSPPDINTSSFTFTPVAADNKILYGLRGIAGISGAKISEIIASRPYVSLEDFVERNSLKKNQIINLIKSGAFDSLEEKPREQIMRAYLESIADKKQRLTLQNMQMLINKELIPEEMNFYAKLFLFNKFLKTCKEDAYYYLNEAAINFISNNFSADIIENGVQIGITKWDNLYKKAMQPMRDYLNSHKDEMLAALNESLYKEVAEKYAEGNISAWEMASVNFYAHDHELAAAAHLYDDFFLLPEEPEIETIFKDDIKIYKLHRIIGTVIDKDKLKNTVTLLTPTGVVNVKIYKNQFAQYDKQLSERGEDGKKRIKDRSWFKRGTLLMIQGIRRGADFVPKKYKKSPYPIISKITSIDKHGNLTFQFERPEVD